MMKINPTVEKKNFFHLLINVFGFGCLISCFIFFDLIVKKACIH